MKIYSRTGDDGYTSLSGGRRVPKHHPRVEAYGSVDELIAWISLLKDFKENKSRESILLYIRKQLMVSATLLATEGNGGEGICRQDDKCVSILEGEIDKMEANLHQLKKFIMPGGNILLSYCHIARCVCRRAERAVVKLYESEEIPEIVIKFLNRLSDYLFVLSRQMSLDLGIEEISWSV
ncbi:MAG TPA: cob(I)yrinic acid a,c-diamide adenosyltransferase [Bacteroidales bacterium]|nr:cob(I)yrinic acid a,c-diamide adenosyltransferase [Bacteroidales bacterium]